MPKLYWLASYPKSGSTWIRALLTSYQGDGEAADINRLDGGALLSDREGFDDWAGISSADLTSAELLPLRARYHAHIAAEPGADIIKVHDAYARTAAGETLFPAGITAGVLYLIRNPLDVAVSYAHHDNTSHDRIIARMANQDFVMARQDGRLLDQFPQSLGSWSQHVRGWVDQSAIKVQVVRYEDLSQNPVATFSRALAFLGREVDIERVGNAVERCRFDRLQAQEAQGGFREKQPTAKSFFREGRIGAGRRVLTSAQVRNIIGDHKKIMTRFGYLDADGHPNDSE